MIRRVSFERRPFRRRSRFSHWYLITLEFPLFLSVKNPLLTQRYREKNGDRNIEQGFIFPTPPFCQTVVSYAKSDLIRLQIYFFWVHRAVLPSGSPTALRKPWNGGRRPGQRRRPVGWA